MSQVQYPYYHFEKYNNNCNIAASSLDNSQELDNLLIREIL